MPETETEWDRNVRFNQFIASLPKKRIEIGSMADGTPLTVEVPTLFPEDSGE